MTCTRRIVTALAFALALLAVHVSSAQAASTGASRKLRGTMTTIAGCTSYSGLIGTTRRCLACTGGLVPGPIGDRCISRQTTRVNGPLPARPGVTTTTVVRRGPVIGH